MVDISHAMILYGEARITPAKKIALALSQLIQTRYPMDTLDVVLFGDDAVQVPLGELMKIQAGPYHTNTKAGLELAARILAGRKGVNKQVFMITDGKPSAIREFGKLYKNPFALDPKIVNKTLEEAAYMRRKRISISTFMLAAAHGPVVTNAAQCRFSTGASRAKHEPMEIPDRVGLPVPRAAVQGWLP
jgi:Ca-activated chloride channel homolog